MKLKFLPIFSSSLCKKDLIWATFPITEPNKVNVILKGASNGADRCVGMYEGDTGSFSKGEFHLLEMLYLDVVSVKCYTTQQILAEKGKVVSLSRRKWETVGPSPIITHDYDGCIQNQIVSCTYSSFNHYNSANC